MHRKPHFVIYSFTHDETSGGTIALHLLCERLRQMGERALIWPVGKPPHRFPRDLRSLKAHIRYQRQRRNGRPFDTGPFANPVATLADLDGAIVVYPEVISGNPLRSRSVVRWFLHRPGHHTGQTGYGPGELYFFYQDAFNDPAINLDPDSRLTLTYLNPAYANRNPGPRDGICCLIRKGKDRVTAHDLEGKTVVDDMTHAEMAAAFNQHEYLHSFDTYSMYSVFAAMCGCVPVIEPMPGVSREQWFPNEADRYGLAYGWDDVAWARETQGLLLERMADDRHAEDRLLARFVAKCQAFFGRA
ncbi:hypothetical protein [Sphingomonas sp. Leaf4]|uniref:hypothetical protein n=1 Tax=Sphingomonas sp. Leaf4 TaxID=2876553 RepID=UPI001E41C93C|nr:hypothetical protein [Sphingomonas sp. Leaf4]